MIDGLSLALVGHLVGDFLAQNDWMALNKKKHSLPCAVHVTIYTLIVMAFTGWFLLPPVMAVCVAASVWLPHFAIDRSQFVAWYMRANGQKAFAKPPMAPWSMIAVDNAMHAACLAITHMIVTRFLV